MFRILKIIFIIFCILYGVYVSFFIKTQKINFSSSPVLLTGYIDDYREERLANNRYRFKIKTYNNININDTARLIIVTDSYTKLNYGDEIKLYGKIKNPKDFTTDSGKNFEYGNYLMLENIYGIVNDPKIIKTGEFSGSYFKKFLFNIRYKFSNALDKNLNYQDSALSRGVLLGEKTGIDNEFRENLARSSTSHIIALSGYNITIVSETIMKLTAGFGLIARSILGSSAIVLFIILAGSGSSALRAGIMALILIYARARGKTYNAINALILGTCILILINPLSLRYDAGFHLSVLATFGLIVFQLPIATYFIKKHFKKWLAEVLASTISASIMTMPYIAYNMGIVSVLGIFANTIVVPMLPILMLTSFLTGITQIVLGKLAYVFALPTHAISWIIINTINKIGSIKFAAIYVQKVSLVLVILIYIILFYIAFKLLKKDS